MILQPKNNSYLFLNEPDSLIFKSIKPGVAFFYEKKEEEWEEIGEFENNGIFYYTDTPLSFEEGIQYAWVQATEDDVSKKETFYFKKETEDVSFSSRIIETFALDQPKRFGDEVDRSFFKEFKREMIEVFQDYKGRGIENEDAWINQINTLFSGEIVPNREDFKVIQEGLELLSTIKEDGIVYGNVVDAVSDTLGISDLYLMKNYIDYVKTLRPRNPSSSISFVYPNRYSIPYLNWSSSDNLDTIDLSWGIQESGSGTITISLSDSSSEDVDSYRVKITIGRYSTDLYYTKSQLDQLGWKISFPFYWPSYFAASDLPSATAFVGTYVKDKRGNWSTGHLAQKTVDWNNVPPSNDYRFEIQYQFNWGAWQVLGTYGKSTRNVKHNVPNVNGNMLYAILAKDVHGRSESDWRYSANITLYYPPPPPAAPSCWADVGVWNLHFKWHAVAHAEYYDVWLGPNESWAQQNGRWTRVWANQGLNVNHTNLAEDTNYKLWIRAVNESGSAVSVIDKRTAKRPVYGKTYGGSDYRTYRYKYENPSRYDYVVKAWKTAKGGPYWCDTGSGVTQGCWKEYEDGWHSGGSYWAPKGTEWGNNAGCWLMNYQHMRNQLKGVPLKSATIRIKRKTTIHGWPSDGIPLYIGNHNATTFKETSFSIWNVAQYNVMVDRGETIEVVGNHALVLVDHIINGGASGICLKKDYPNGVPEADKAYMRFDGWIEIYIEHY